MADEAPQPRILPINGQIFTNPYDWGGTHLIPETLGFPAEQGVPYAEYWLGVHKKAPSEVSLPDGTTTTLDVLLEKNPQLGSVPFLFKLLEAAEMLSIQVHPNEIQAKEGFAREEQEGIAIDDPKRTYKDSNHKPEFAVALGDFWLLHGFRQPDDLKNVLASVKELAPLIPVFEEKSYEGLYRYVMSELSDQDANAMLSELAKRLLPQFDEGQIDKASPDYWTCRAIRYLRMDEKAYDRGIFSIYFLNLVNLQPGQGMFQDAGILHAYLEGPIIEVMANSDNVARGGITHKYIDVQELLKLVRFESVTPAIVEGRLDDIETFWDAPINEFQVSRIMTSKPYQHTAASAEILMGMEGTASISAANETQLLTKGRSVFVPVGTSYSISGTETDIIFKTSVPQNEQPIQ